MSYDIELQDPVTGEVLQLDSPQHMKGGTYAVGGTLSADLNIAYNYAGIFVEVLGERGIRTIYGKTGAESIPILKQAIDQLGDDVDNDYWKATEGNAKRALNMLLAFAKMRSDGVWDGD